jgi:hypothetical protein
VLVNKEDKEAAVGRYSRPIFHLPSQVSPVELASRETIGLHIDIKLWQHLVRILDASTAEEIRRESRSAIH